MALRDKLMRRDLFEDFCHEYVRELNRLRMEHRASLSHGRQELASVEREIRNRRSRTACERCQSRTSSYRSKRGRPYCRRALPLRKCRSCCADVYSEKVGNLCLALEGEESRAGAVEAIRALIESCSNLTATS